MSSNLNIKLSDLELDPLNPRLPSTIARAQSDMIEYIARTTSISEIMEAIAENDYFPGEPLIVIPGNTGKFIVIEGNRRLTALKLIHDPGLLGKSSRVRAIAENAKFRPEDIPCVLFDTRDEVLNYLGYRHITGVKQWEPLAKARYIAGYFDNHTNVGDAPTTRYSMVARGIGSQGPYVKRQLDGLSIYNQIESQEFFGIKGLDEENISFSLISTAVGYESILSFLSESEHPYVDPSRLRHDNIHHLARWMFDKDDDGATVLGDSRNIQRLAVILTEPTATQALIIGDSLDKAYALTKGLSEDFATVLAEAEGVITRAVSMVALIDLAADHRSRIDNISRQAKVLKSQADAG